jgi:hypothetical protein
MVLSLSSTTYNLANHIFCEHNVESFLSDWSLVFYQALRDYTLLPIPGRYEPSECDSLICCDFLLYAEEAIVNLA